MLGIDRNKKRSLEGKISPMELIELVGMNKAKGLNIKFHQGFVLKSNLPLNHSG